MTGIIPSLPWRDMETSPRNGAIFAVWFREWNRDDGEPRIQFAQWLDPYLTGAVLCAPWNYDSRPTAYGWLPIEELNALVASVDTHPKDGDVQQAPLVSGAVPAGQTPKESP